MSLSMRLTEHVRACFSGIWIQSWEHEDALAEIAGLCRQEAWRLAVWSIDRGLSIAAGQADSQPAAAGADPLAAIRAVSAMAIPDTPALLVLVNFHRFLSSAEIVQTLASQIAAGKQNRTFLVILSPVVQLPIELEKLFAVLEHDLPDREQLAQIAQGVATEPGELPEEQGLAAILDAAAGLTRYEAESAFALSLVRHGRLAADEVWQLKGGMLKKSGLVRLHEGSERFADLGGLDAIKDFCLRSMRAQAVRDPRKRPRGILLLGVPGTGKSFFAKALGNETGRPTLVLDVGALLGSLVGQSEAQMRQALKIADAMAPAVLFIDEVEKALSGASSGAVTDSGVSARMFGSMLTWLSDHESDVYVVCTANDVSRLPPEFSRAERFDSIWFLDLPAAQERRSIWRMYLEYYSLDVDQPRPVDADFTGAEIKACCRLAALLDCSLIDAAKNVVPVARTAAETVERLRGWAEGRCLAADQGGIYRRQPTTTAKPGRKVSRDPSQN